MMLRAPYPRRMFPAYPDGSFGAPLNTPEARTPSSVINAPPRYDGMTLDTYPRDVPDGLRDLVASPRSCVLHGQNGSGKTALGLEVLRESARLMLGRGEVWDIVTDAGLRRHNADAPADRFVSPSWFETWSTLLERRRRELRGTSEMTREWFMDELPRVATLMLDDVGTESGTEFRELFLLWHLNWAEDHPGRALIMTVNCEPEQWTKVFGARCADRMNVFACVHVSGGSLR